MLVRRQGKVDHFACMMHKSQLGKGRLVVSWLPARTVMSSGSHRLIRNLLELLGYRNRCFMRRSPNWPHARQGEHKDSLLMRSRRVHCFYHKQGYAFNFVGILVSTDDVALISITRLDSSVDFISIVFLVADREQERCPRKIAAQARRVAHAHSLKLLAGHWRLVEWGAICVRRRQSLTSFSWLLAVDELVEQRTLDHYAARAEENGPRERYLELRKTWWWLT
jgi:hypothetical protein